jgi:hypothetical protein
MSVDLWLSQQSRGTRCSVYLGTALFAIATIYFIWTGTKYAAPRVSEQEDMAAYTLDLKKKIPIQIDQFKASGYEADEYRISDNPNVFESVAVRVKRVYIVDSITSKGGWYTRARLANYDSNSSGQTARVESVKSFANRAQANAFKGFAWSTVEMLP